ncbi:hypothetical protein YTPLAS18_20630 [Nitrospira sp.]|nr:hypothetical protein YTPLAS18_20630 [Nitrospira sp.]
MNAHRMLGLSLAPPKEAEDRGISSRTSDLITTLQGQVPSLDPSSLFDLIGSLERVKAMALHKLLAPKADRSLSLDTGKYLTVKEVCDRYGVKAKWLYRHKHQIPHSQPSRKVLLFPEKPVEKWFASRKCP